MNKEQCFLDIINTTLTKNSHIGDDCAYLKEYNLVISQDTLVQGVHFKLSTINAKDLGKKSVLVNLSDILASGAKPNYITISLSGTLDENFVEDFYCGVNEICKEYNIEVIGGDLTAGTKVVISICAFGDTKNRNISSRKNAAPGYKVLLAGYHGSSATGLMHLEMGINEGEFVDAHILPVLYPNVSETIALNTSEPYAMMDTSDGLYDALNKIRNASNVGFEIDYSKVLKKVKEPDLVLFGGEDYGLLVCVSNDDYQKIKHCENLVQIGATTNTRQIIIDGEIINEDKSFEHFS